MGTIFHTPAGYLNSNIGLLAGTVIRELRMHPYIDSELEGGQWNHRPEYLEFTIQSVWDGGYTCQYSGEENTFSWPTWKEQPLYGFMDDGSTPVRYYVQDAPIPLPYENKTTSFSPYGLRCAEIDSAVQLIKDPEAFAALAAEPEVSPQEFGIFLERPSKRFLSEGGCPCYRGKLNFGYGANVLCGSVQKQLHGYIETKFCESGRKIYCPIWKAECNQLIVPNLDTKGD